ncbi:MAG: YicC family protein [Tidjanibacter sp.]|nr:YicC family protein [Tidjanibacter sp.]MBR2424211.1 YicC family protein [Tidjanibacter sp.]
MTGFGKAEITTAERKITVETRSLNGKQLDLSVKMPARYRQFEYEVRNKVAKELQRGKVDLFVTVENTSGKEASVAINEPLFKAYSEQLMGLAAASGLGFGSEVQSQVLAAVMRMPDVVATEVDTVGEEEKAALLQAVDEALRQHNEFRQHEGQILIADLLHRVEMIEGYRKAVEPYEQARTETIKKRILDQFAQVGVAYDAARLEQEMIYYLEKLDITEEKVRLDKHCAYFRAVATEEESVGRKLGFVAQEMGREINTMGSKSNDSEMQILVVKMKDELEKIKEQVLNIL